MNFDQFATNFQYPEGSARCGEIGVENQEGDVILAGTILAVTDESCCIDINGAQYEFASGDVIDIQVISPTKTSPVDESEAAKTPPDDEGGKGYDKSEDAEGASAKRGPQTVVIRVNKNAILWRRVPVPAALLAAVGTWMQIVLPDAEAA
jgi:hypothetical protein